MRPRQGSSVIQTIQTTRLGAAEASPHLGVIILILVTKLSTFTSGDVGPGSLGSSSSSLLEDSPRLLPTTYTPSPPRLPRLRPVSRSGKKERSKTKALSHTHPLCQAYNSYILSMQYGRTQSAPLPLAHPGLLAPPEVRQGKTSPELDGAGGSLVKQQIRQSVLSRHHRAQHQVVFLLCHTLV